MRKPLDISKLNLFLEELGKAAKGPGTVYLTGGASALLFGWREMTVDVDLKFDPEPTGVFDSISSLKDRLDINIELAAPNDFVPALPGWKERCQWICTWNQVDFHHFDFFTQAFSKIERGHSKDIQDVEAMVARELINYERLNELVGTLSPAEFARYPSVESEELRAKIRTLADSL